LAANEAQRICSILSVKFVGYGKVIKDWVYKLVSATCLQKTGPETGFLAQKLDRLLGRNFQGRISERKAEQVFKTGTGLQTGPKTGSQAGQVTLLCSKRLF
jgi:hypothetical protein